MSYHPPHPPERGSGTPEEAATADNAALSTPQRRETADVVDGVRRLIRAVGRRVAEADPHDLHLLRELDLEVEHAFATAVAGLRRTGYSDTQIGEALGVTRQAVRQRWPHTPRGWPDRAAD